MLKKTGKCCCHLDVFSVACGVVTKRSYYEMANYTIIKMSFSTALIESSPYSM